MNNEEKEIAAIRGYKDLIYFGQMFAPKDFLMQEETPPFHLVEAEIVLDRNNEKILELWPRGFSKTTIFSKLFALHTIMYQDENFPELILLLGETQDGAKTSLRWIKKRIESEEIKAVFGDLVGDKWTESEIVLKNGAKILSKGTGQASRGLNEDHMRVTLCLPDDFESELNTKTAESRKANADWLTSTIFPMLDPKRGRIVASNTIVHEDSWANNILNSYNKAVKMGDPFSWKVRLYKAIKEDGTALWEDRFSLEHLEKERLNFIHSGTPNKFYQEYMNEPISSEDRKFSAKDFRYWEGNYTRGQINKVIRNENGDITDTLRIPVEVTIGVDPAISLKSTADRTWILPIATDANDNVYVLPYFVGRIQANEIVDMMFEYYKKYDASCLVLETTAFQEALYHYADEKMRKDGEYINIRQVKPRTAKSVRIDAMQPHFAVHKVFMQDNMYDLLHELEYFPDGKHDDGVDAMYNAWSHRIKFTPVTIVKDDRDDYERALMKDVPYPYREATHSSIPQSKMWKVS